MTAAHNQPVASAEPTAPGVQAGPAVLSAVPVYQAERLHTLDEFVQRCAALWDDNALPFHHPHWLRAWYQALAHEDGATPLMVAVRRQGAPGDVLMLPLVLRPWRGLHCVSYADAGVVDYAAPLVAPGWHGGADQPAAAAALWAAVRAMLPGDVLLLEKMLPSGLVETGRRANPLALALPLRQSSLWGNQLEVTGTWDAWRQSLDKRVRKEIERCWRVFHRSPEARFERIISPERATEIFTVLEQQQSQRLVGQLGDAYKLDRPAYRAFYRQLLGEGLADGSVVLTALLDGPHVVSALFGIANRSRYIGLRQSLGGEAWKACSPGRLLDEQTARHMQAQGCSLLDFGVGSYFHKTTLKMAPIPLFDVCVPLTLRGQPAAAAWRLKKRLKAQPRLMAAWRRWQALKASAAQRRSAPP